MQLTKERYQLMPPLSQEEYEALKADMPSAAYKCRWNTMSRQHP